MKNKSNITMIGILAFCLCMLQSCRHPDIVQPAVPLDPQKSEALLGFANMTSALTAEIYRRAQVLRDSALIFIHNPTEGGLSSLQNTWINARVPWEMQEAFEVGPVETLGIDPGVDTWPVDTHGIDIAVPNVPGFLSTAPLGIKGYHGIEYIIWGANGTKQAGDFTPNQFILLDSITRDLVNEVQTLNNQWGVNGPFYLTFTQAGTSNSIYADQNAALSDALNAIAGLVQEMTQDKLGLPLQNTTIYHGESQYSDNSLADYKNDLLSIKAAYTGMLSINNEQYFNFTNLVNPRNSQLNNSIVQQIGDIQIQLLSLPASFNYIAQNDTTQLRQIVNGFLKLEPQFTSGVSNLLFNKTAIIVDTD